MPSKKSNPFSSLTLRIASSRAGSWLYARVLHRLDNLFLRLSGGRMTISSLTTGLTVVMVTATGAKSGLPRTVPLLCFRDERDPDTFALVASNWGQPRYPAWYFNLKANPRVTCSIAGVAGEYLAHEAQGEEYARFWQYAVDAYVGYARYKQRIQGRSIPIMVMTPLRPQAGL